MNMIKKLFLVLLLFAQILNVRADVVCRNPLIWADVPDPDIIRVGDTYYLVSTTMHLMPGGPIMASKNLTDWTIVGYLFDKLTDSPKYNMEGGTVYGHGQWATSLRYHNGRFYALFAPNDSPGGDSYVYSTTDPSKGWTLVSRLPHFHDASLFFDDDGRVYVFHGCGNCTELTSDLTAVKPNGVDTVVFQRDSTETGLLEGSRMVKYHGRYYLLMISWPNGKPRRQVCFRADNILGPYEKKVILQDNFAGFPYAGQGTIVDSPDGHWYGLIFQDRGGVGRVLTLEPCTWRDGWPILGDSEGRIPASFTLPLPAGDGKSDICISDEFKSPRLQLAWQWNHNPIDSKWSLTERPDFLRLHTPNVCDNLFAARNTISQRLMGPVSTVTVALDVSHMNEGDRTGLSAFQSDAAMLMVSRDEQGYKLSMNVENLHVGAKNMTIEKVDKHEEEEVRFKSTPKRIYLQMRADFRLNADTATFAYSTDNKTWHPLGTSFKMCFDYQRLFMGTRAAVFCYATKKLGGYVDMDWYHIKVSNE
ncbi:MAG: glycoside hydrolase 43 family protein [Prevotella sp.]